MDPITGVLIGVGIGEIAKDTVLIAEQSYIERIPLKDTLHYNEKDIYCQKWYNDHGMYGDHSLTA